MAICMKIMINREILVGVFSIFRDKTRNLQVGRGVFGESQENFFFGSFHADLAQKKMVYMSISSYNML